MSLRALKRALRALAEAGLIAFTDNPTGRPIGKRKPHTNKIVLDRTFGIDLSPLGVRTRELEMLAADDLGRNRCGGTPPSSSYVISGASLPSSSPAATKPFPDHGKPLQWTTTQSFPLVSPSQAVIWRARSIHERLLAVFERANTAYAQAAEDFPSRARRTPSTASGENGRKNRKKEHQIQDKRT